MRTALLAAEEVTDDGCREPRVGDHPGFDDVAEIDADPVVRAPGLPCGARALVRLADDLLIQDLDLAYHE
jgi:hypothetical protein